jgi:ferric-dicitrate binding protein FerR (iron transport regulator)
VSEEENEEKLDLSAWDAQLPPSDFAERVLAEVRPKKAEEAKRRPWAKIAGGVASTLAVAAALAVGIGRPPSSGDTIAKERIEVSLGTRARAVLEPGAHVTWNGDEVTQPNGDVFYRVEPGAKFRVHTPAGDVEVKGTCFTVKVVDMQKRDVKSGVVGAALSALAFVAVYEGKVAVSHAGQRADLSAGEAARTGADGVVKGGLAEGQKDFDTQVALADAGDPLSTANENLVSQVSEYRKRLEAIASQKNDLEKKLATTEKQLEAARADGAVGPAKNEYDLSAEDWKELAQKGSVKARIPCMRESEWNVSPDKLNHLGLAPQDAATLKGAYKYSTERMWAKIKPLCTAALGSAEAAEKVGPSTCQFLILDLEEGKDPDAAKAAMKLVGEVRGGLKPAPGPNDPTNPVYSMFMAVTNSIHDFENNLAQSFGPEEAHRITYADGICMGGSHWR